MSSKLSFKNEGEIKRFPDVKKKNQKQKIRELINSRPALQKMLQAEMKGH